MITANDVHEAIEKWPSIYETKDGELVVGETVSSVPKALRENRWKGVPRLDCYDLKRLGCRVVTAQYVNGARPTGRFVDVVAVKAYTGPTPPSIVRRDERRA